MAGNGVRALVGAERVRVIAQDAIEMQKSVSQAFHGMRQNEKENENGKDDDGRWNSSKLSAILSRSRLQKD